MRSVLAPSLLVSLLLAGCAGSTDGNGEGTAGEAMCPGCLTWRVEMVQSRGQNAAGELSVENKVDALLLDKPTGWTGRKDCVQQQCYVELFNLTADKNVKVGGRYALTGLVEFGTPDADYAKMVVRSARTLD
jgi:hypothetical protein